MAEIAAPAPRENGALRALKLLALAAGSALVVGGLLAHQYPKLVAPLHSQPKAFAYPRPHEPLELTRLPRDAAAEAKALQKQNNRDTQLGDAAARAFDRGIFVSSPGGVMATAARVARWKPLIVRATRGSGISPNLLEALVFVESSGYRDAVGRGRKVGLMQMTPWLARSLGVRVDRTRKHVRLLASVRTRVDNRDRAVPTPAQRGPLSRAGAQTSRWRRTTSVRRTSRLRPVGRRCRTRRSTSAPPPTAAVRSGRG